MGQRFLFCLATFVLYNGSCTAHTDNDSHATISWHGARPTTKTFPVPLPNSRLGAEVNVGDVEALDVSHAAQIVDAVRAHGVIVIKNQHNLTRSAQIEFTKTLGEIVIVPNSNSDCLSPGVPENECHPAVQRNANFWYNGTWKGPDYRVGAYWHQDGQFWSSPKHNIISVLYAQQAPKLGGGETGFVDMREAYATLPNDLMESTDQASIVVDVRAIADFASWADEDLARFPVATHPMLTRHVLDGGPLLYVGSPFSAIAGLETKEAGKHLLKQLMGHASKNSSSVYYHQWEAGDILIWDNTQTLHRSMPYKNTGTEKRELYRTQAAYGPSSFAQDEL